ncbi:MAG TPA: hypothetical protein VKV28_07930 [Candidatus Binataceae bacterium]|nr:hypothetical protein [Candidatus Binataceae bacterium]
MSHSQQSAPPRAKVASVALVRHQRPSRRLLAAARALAERINRLDLAQPNALASALKWRQEIGWRQEQVVQWFAPAKQAAYAAHAAICRQENQALAPYRVAREGLDEKLMQWQCKHPQHRQELEQACAAARDASGRGLSVREHWRAEVIDLLALVRAVARDSRLLYLLQPNLGALNHLAHAQHAGLHLPGIQVTRVALLARDPHPAPPPLRRGEKNRPDTLPGDKIQAT